MRNFWIWDSAGVVCSHLPEAWASRHPLKTKPGLVSGLPSVELELSAVYMSTVDEDGVNRGEEVRCQRKSRKE